MFGQATHLWVVGRIYELLAALDFPPPSMPMGSDSYVPVFRVLQGSLQSTRIAVYKTAMESGCPDAGQ